MQRSLTWLGYAFIAALMLFVLSPILVILPVSFGSGNMFQIPAGGWSVARYQELFQDERIWSSVWLSFVVGVSSTVVAAVIGLFAAVGIVRGKLPFKGALESFFLGPLIVPLVTTGIGFLILFVPLGILSSPVSLVLAHSIVICPYVVRIATATLRHMDPALEEAAIVHGAQAGYAFRTVVLPQMTPAMISGALLAFLVSVDEYTVTSFLAQTNTITLPIRIYQLVSMDINPVVTALAGLTVIVSIAIVLILEKKFAIHEYLEMKSIIESE
ncbi:ABC transporter permease [Paenibacillus thermotolerans]|uniref:ABC transporter permease n=1 Tax=Paenibacillus thermotolerans TaxID=3027807 RepID=UPI002368AE46|nr:MULTISPECIES: ABC transporter permease [unclassified Paenibacillus]